MARDTTHSRLPSNVRRRRQEHLAREAARRAAHPNRDPSPGLLARRRIRAAKLGLRGTIDLTISGETATLPYDVSGEDVQVAFQVALPSRSITTVVAERAEGPFKVGRVKTKLGWPVLDSAGDVVQHIASRSEARDLVKRANAGEVEIVRSKVVER